MKYTKRELELRVKIRTAFNYDYEELYKLLQEYYNSRKKKKEKYTYNNMALELDISNATIYRIMAWDYATEYSKQMVREGKIQRINLCRVLHAMTREIGSIEKNQNEVVKCWVNNKLSLNDIEIYVDKYVLQKKSVLEDKQKRIHRWHLIRDVDRHSTNLLRTLQLLEFKNNFDNLDDVDKNQIKEKIINIKSKCNEVLKIL